MNRTITVLLAILLAVSLLASISGSVAAQEEDGIDTTVCTIETPYEATDNAEANLCQPEYPDDGATILTVPDPENNGFFHIGAPVNLELRPL